MRVSSRSPRFTTFSRTGEQVVHVEDTWWRAEDERDRRGELTWKKEKSKTMTYDETLRACHLLIVR